MVLVMEDIEVKKKEWIKKHCDPDGPMSNEWWEEEVEELKKRLSPESRFNDEWWEEDV